MNLKDLSLILIGKKSKREIVSLFFPYISSRKVNILNMKINNDNIIISDSALSRVINLSYSYSLRSNAANTIFIYKLISFTGNGTNLKELLEYYSKKLDDIEYFSQQNYKTVMDSFKDCLILIDKSGLISTKYLDIINTYILNKRYNIVLFLMGSLLILSSAIRNMQTLDQNDIRYKHLNRALEIINDLENYSKYLNTKYYIYQEYIPINKENFKTDSKETLLVTSKYTNARDDINKGFFINILKDYSCKELYIISKFASSWTVGELYETLLERLKSNSITVKMLLMNTDTTFAYIYNDNQNHLKNNNFAIYEQLTKDFPNNFFLKYVNIPLTNRLVCDISNKKMRIDYLIVPQVSKKVLVNYFHGNNTDEIIYYNQYLKQFEEIWNKYSIDVENQYDYSKLCTGNVSEDKFYNFYSYCLDTSKNIRILSPTAFSWVSDYNVTRKLSQRLQEKDFKIEFILLDPNTDSFSNIFGNIQDNLSSVLGAQQGFKDLLHKYPNNVSVYLTRHFIENTLTINLDTEIIRADAPIWYSEKPYNVRPCMIIPNNDTDVYGYYSAYLQEYDFIKHSKETYRLNP